MQLSTNEIGTSGALAVARSLQDKKDLQVIVLGYGDRGCDVGSGGIPGVFFERRCDRRFLGVEGEMAQRGWRALVA